MNRKELFLTAHVIKGKFESFPLALSHSHKVMKLKNKMRNEYAKFMFHKVDGTLRLANGTLNVTYERKTDRKRNYALLTYFDAQKRNFRTAKIENLFFDYPNALNF